LEQEKKSGAYLPRIEWAVLAFLVLMALGAVFARPVENFVHDLKMSTVSPWTDPPRDIVLVTVTEDTLKQFAYRSPIDRGFLAALVTKIAAAKPKAIGIDILFDQATEPEKDAALKAALIEAVDKQGVPIILAEADKSDGLSDKQSAYLDAFSSGIGRGLVTLLRDPLDGVVRRMFLGRQTDEGWKTGFVAALAEAGGGVAGNQATGGENGQGSRDLVYYRQGNAVPFAFTAYPAHAAAMLPPAWFAGKYVLIGVDLPFDDRHTTPFAVPNGVTAGTLPGVVIHAHGLAQVLAGDRVIAVPTPVVWLIGLAMCAAAAWLAWRPLPILFKPIVVVGLIAAYWAAGIAAFNRFGVDVPLVAPSILAAGGAAFSAFLAWRRDSQERQFIQQAFSQYVSPAVVGSILKDPESLRLGGERREITCVFTDLEGFTSFSEKLPPERTAAILNAYLDDMCSLFVEHGATLDKLVGDAVVGFFGAPVDQPDQADRAIALALAIDNFSQDFRRKMKEDGVSLGVTRVGVHSGPAIVGNFGGRRFFDYTAIGDTVNTAARLEGGNKYIGTRISISEAVVALSSGRVALRP
jgi:adenylate cyclase